MSSINDSDDSSDIEGMGIIVNEDAAASTDKIASDGNLENSNKHISKPTSTATKSLEDSHGRSTVHDSKLEGTSPQSVLKAKKDHPIARDDVTYQSTVLPNVTQDVLFQLIESGHLQVHTEEGT